METKEIKLPDSVKREEKEEVLEEVYDSLNTFKASVISENSEFINKEVDIEWCRERICKDFQIK